MKGFFLSAALLACAMMLHVSVQPACAGGWTPEHVAAVKQMAEEGKAEWQAVLGDLHRQGLFGVRQDYAEACRWYEKAAMQGYADAQLNLGVMFFDGKGVRQSYAEARRWYEKAAAQGNSGAQFNLGVMYYEGLSVRQNYAEARRWFERAAAQGNAGAQFNLGVMYNNGESVRQDKRVAKEWYGRACDNGDQEGCNSYRRLNEAGF